jgi:hypothetical protein
MLKFFDYVFYRVCKAYSSSKDDSPEFAAVCILAGMQSFNILSLVMIFVLIQHDKSIISKYLVVFLIIGVIIINYRKYIFKESNNYRVLKERYFNESIRSKNKNGIVALLYIIISSFLFLGLVIFLGTKRW